MTYDNLLEFLGHHKRGKLRRHLKVEDETEDITLNGTIYDIKGDNKLKEFINNKNMDIVVLYYAHFEHHS